MVSLIIAIVVILIVIIIIIIITIANIVIIGGLVMNFRTAFLSGMRGAMLACFSTAGCTMCTAHPCFLYPFFEKEMK